MKHEDLLLEKSSNACLYYQCGALDGDSFGAVSAATQPSLQSGVMLHSGQDMRCNILSETLACFQC